MMELKSKKNILVLGAKWMLWNSIFSYLWKNTILNIFWTSSKEELWYIPFLVNLDYLDNLDNLFKNYKFDYVINCIWSIRPDDKIDSYNKTLLINSHLPKSLQKLSNKYDFKLVHFSTDCVFNWMNWDYSIDDIPNEFGLYWLSKYLWEIDDNKNLTIRTSIIGLELWNSKNLLNWFLSNKDWAEIYWYSNVLWNWLTTLTIAKILEKIIIDNIELSGVHQFWGNKISKYDLLILFNKIFWKKIIIKQETSIKSNKVIIPSIKQVLFNEIITSIEKQIIELKKFYKL